METLTDADVVRYVHFLRRGLIQDGRIQVPASVENEEAMVVCFIACFCCLFPCVCALSFVVVDACMLSMCVRVCVCVCICIHLYACMCVVCVCAYLHVCTYVYINKSMHACGCVCVCHHVGV